MLHITGGALGRRAAARRPNGGPACLGLGTAAPHPVVNVVEGHTVRYASIETDGTDYQDRCVTPINHQNIPIAGVGLILLFTHPAY